MEFVINRDKFRSDFSLSKENENKNSVKHSTGKNIGILPYTTKYENKHKEFIQGFKVCIGEFCRRIYQKKIKNDDININDVDNIIKDVDVEPEDKIALKSIIKELFFDEKGNIYTFHPLLLNYIDIKKGDYNKSLANFLYDVLLNDKDNDVVDKIVECFKYRPENVMELLLLENLPELQENKSKSKQKYKNCVYNVSSIFKEDLSFMLDNPEFFIKDFEKLLKYYYFFYVSQLSLKLSKFFDYNPYEQEELYFNLDWETASKSRTSYLKGWKMLESTLRPLFSHANTLEILNSNEQDISYDYYDIKEIISSYDEDKKYEVKSNISQIVFLYKENITDVVWDEFNVDRKYDDDIQNTIYELFKTIDHQFNKSSSRKKPYESYKKWFEEFCKINFLRRRGSLGYTLNITQEYLLFITKVSIKDKERIKLKDLFEEYKKRGLYLDRDSQSKIVELFEKLNLIEKKSDSGDAQYVRSIL
ncbi:DNA phosphorothioation-dependent restriction protein DptG [Tepidibacter sp. Z1-5]|uniref:DNA phosphorothioation-dependent restriction protein DptG n=1 Tax=Tepidibacter sp. Z1-5 TaxID=3134138 RepID=UPI0030BD214B